MLYDFAIIGGGPAGFAAGITLLLHTNKTVVVIEGAGNRSLPVGETVSSGILPLMEYLQLDKTFLEDAHLPSYGNAAAWGTDQLNENDHLFNGSGNGWHLNRLAFDNRLREKFLQLNGVIEQAAFNAADFTNDAWQLHTTVKGQPATYNARFVIEASGRKNAFLRSINVEHFALDKLSAVIGVFNTNTTGPGRVLLESTHYGWWYCAPLPNQQVVVNLFSDHDIIRAQALHKPAVWWELLCHTKQIAPVLAAAEWNHKVMVKPAHTCIAAQVFDKRWIAAGDAACAFDPISSLGIGYALSSGTHAARCGLELLTKDKSSFAEAYADGVLNNFKNYLSIRKAFYAKEKRWSNDPFWRRRSAIHSP